MSNARIRVIIDGLVMNQIAALSQVNMKEIVNAACTFYAQQIISNSILKNQLSMFCFMLCCRLLE